MKIETFEMSAGELQAAVNQGKDLLLSQLEKDGIITDAAKHAQTYAIVLVQRGWFGVILDKVFGIEDGKTQLRVMKVL